jgi:hypothetical protein
MRTALAEKPASPPTAHDALAEAHEELARLRAHAETLIEQRQAAAQVADRRRAERAAAAAAVERARATGFHELPVAFASINTPAQAATMPAIRPIK